MIDYLYKIKLGDKELLFNGFNGDSVELYKGIGIAEYELVFTLYLRNGTYRNMALFTDDEVIIYRRTSEDREWIKL